MVYAFESNVLKFNFQRPQTLGATVSEKNSGKFQGCPFVTAALTFIIESVLITTFAMSNLKKKIQS